MKKFSLVLAMLAVALVFGLALVGCKNDSEEAGTSDPQTIRITDVPSNWAGTIGVYIFSDFRTGGPPTYVAGGVYSFSGGIINAELSPSIASGEYYITIQPSNSTRDGYVYFGGGNSPLKSNIGNSLTTVSFNQFQQYNVWR